MNSNYFLNKTILYENVNIIDIFKKFKFKSISSNDYIYYSIKNNETPESISYNYYGSTDYWWIILLFNNIFDPFYNWPINQNDLEQYVKDNTPDYQIYPEIFSENLELAKIENETYRVIKLPKNSIIDKLKIDIINHYL